MQKGISISPLEVIKFANIIFFSTWKSAPVQKKASKARKKSETGSMPAEPFFDPIFYAWDFYASDFSVWFISWISVSLVKAKKWNDHWNFMEHIMELGKYSNEIG